MKQIKTVLYDPNRERLLLVPAFMQVVSNDGERVVIEGKAPDNNHFVDRFLRITLDFDDGHLSRTCKVHRRQTSGPKYFDAGKVRRHTALCNTSWVLTWLEEGLG